MCTVSGATLLAGCSPGTGHGGPGSNAGGPAAPKTGSGQGLVERISPNLIRAGYLGPFTSAQPLSELVSTILANGHGQSATANPTSGRVPGTVVCEAAAQRVAAGRMGTEVLNGTVTWLSVPADVFVFDSKQSRASGTGQRLPKTVLVLQRSDCEVRTAAFTS